MKGPALRRAFVDGPRQDALAGAALAAQQHRRLAGRHLEGHIERLRHGRLVRLEVRFRGGRAHLVAQPGDFLLQLADAGPALQHQTQLIGSERLGKVIEGAAAHRLDGRIDAGKGRHHDHAHARGVCPQEGQQVHALFAAQAQIEEHQVELVPAHLLPRLLTAGSLGNRVAHAFQRDPQRPSQTDFIIDQQQVHRGRPPGPSPVEWIVPCRGDRGKSSHHDCKNMSTPLVRLRRRERLHHAPAMMAIGAPCAVPCTFTLFLARKVADCNPLRAFCIAPRRPPAYDSRHNPIPGSFSGPWPDRHTGCILSHSSWRTKA